MGGERRRGDFALKVWSGVGRRTKMTKAHDLSGYSLRVFRFRFCYTPLGVFGPPQAWAVGKDVSI